MPSLKRIVLFLSFLSTTALLSADTTVSLHVGGSTYCDEEGCFGPTGIAYGGTFTQAINDRWSFDVDATLACTWEDLPERLDDNGILFIPERERTRFWAGVALIRNFSDPRAARSHFYAGAGVVGGHEWQKTIPKSGGTYSRKRESGVKAGISAIAGYQFRFTDRWAIAPEVRFYLLPDSLSAVRYSAVLSGTF